MYSYEVHVFFDVICKQVWSVHALSSSRYVADYHAAQFFEKHMKCYMHGYYVECYLNDKYIQFIVCSSVSRYNQVPQIEQLEHGGKNRCVQMCICL